MPVFGIIASSRLTGGLPVSGASLWLDAADETTFSFSSGTRVSEWRDKSGNGYDFTQATAAYQPDRSATQNGKSALILRPNGEAAKYYVRNTSWNWANQAFTVLTVVRPNTGEFSGYISQDNTGTIHLGQNSSSPGALALSRVGQATAASDLTHTIDVTFQATYKSAGVSAGSATVQIYKNKVAANATQTLSSYTTQAVSMIGGSQSNLGAAFADPFKAGTTSGFICEMLIYPSQLNDTDRESVEDYLIDKWGL
jgi:hypothetical protein